MECRITSVRDALTRTRTRAWPLGILMRGCSNRRVPRHGTETGHIGSGGHRPHWLFPQIPATVQTTLGGSAKRPARRCTINLVEETPVLRTVPVLECIQVLRPIHPAPTSLVSIPCEHPGRSGRSRVTTRFTSYFRYVFHKRHARPQVQTGTTDYVGVFGGSDTGPGDTCGIVASGIRTAGGAGLGGTVLGGCGLDPGRLSWGAETFGVATF